MSRNKLNGLEPYVEYKVIGINDNNKGEGGLELSIGDSIFFKLEKTSSPDTKSSSSRSISW